VRRYGVRRPAMRRPQGEGRPGRGWLSPAGSLS
jgi:hypothetical protein